MPLRSTSTILSPANGRAEQAQGLGANAVIGVDLDYYEISDDLPQFAGYDSPPGSD